MNLPFANRGFGSGNLSEAYDARPLVAIRRKDRSPWWFAGGALIAALLLFLALEAQRRGTEEAEADRGAPVLAGPEAVPELVVPDLAEDPTPQLVGVIASSPQVEMLATPMPRTVPQRLPSAQSSFQRHPDYAPGAFEQPTASPINGRTAYPQMSIEPSPPPSRPAANGAPGRVVAARLENPATTVIQGTLINAVLETAFDSTRPGQARAVVTRDVYGFDGTKLLVPRGSRLYGRYEADVAQGQNRAQILWTRLLRPDGVSVSLDSPSADPLGRAGIKGKVNSHFFQRLGNALVGAAGTVGSTLVTRNVATSPVVVAVPGSTQGVQPNAQPTSRDIMPTLTVKQGTRISVFVQHDLDFSDIEGVP